MEHLQNVSQSGAFREIKDILAYVPPDQRADDIIDCAVSIARMFDAHIDGIALIGHSTDPQMLVGASSSALEIVMNFETAMSCCVRALHQFEIAAQHAGIVYGTKAICDRSESVDRKLCHASRLYDLSIVMQPQVSNPNYDNALPEVVLFDSGRPMVMVPCIHRGPFRSDRIAICWDGGRSAARAVHDAMPLLRKAKAIDIIAVNENDPTGPMSSDALVGHLNRHQLGGRVQRLKSDHWSIHTTILSAAADAGSDLMIMGGYGHSKFGEFILGGVTRGIFESMTVPAFISH
jgi:hypothetical protein